MKNLLKSLTIQQKMKLCAGKDFWHTEDCDGKLYEVTVSDGPIGLRTPNDPTEWSSGDIPAVAYPSTEVLSQTFNPALAYKTGECLADDCIERGVDVLLAPGVNIKRHPFCGRNFEYVSEDPLCAGIFGKEYINGVQAHHVGTSLKHYVANNKELGRLWTSSEVDERTLREIYLVPFEIALQAKPTTVMSSYNRVNGRLMSEHGKLFKILREDLGFGDGMLMSDWDAVRDHTASIKAGCDWEMPHCEAHYEQLVADFEAGKITEEEIDACALRVLNLIARCEADSKQCKIASTVAQRYDAAQKVAEEGIVLLKNNGILPLKDGLDIAVLGWEPDKYFCGEGSSKVVPLDTPVGFTDCMKAVLPNSKFQTISACDKYQYILAHEAGYGKDVVFCVFGDDERESWDRTTMRLPPNEEQQILHAAEENENVVVVLHFGAAVDVSPWADKVAAIVWAGYTGSKGNEALANLITGKVNFSGRLSETFANHYEDYPCASTFANHAVTVYSEGLEVGYRYFDRHPEKVRYPFGFGLSYSDFEYSNLKIKQEGDNVCVCFTVKNVSKVDGAEVPQVYVHEVHPVVFRPYKELRAFDKVFLKGGESKQLSFTLDRRAFAHYSTAYDAWTVTPGAFEIQVGKNTRDICLKQTVQVK